MLPFCARVRRNDDRFRHGSVRRSASIAVRARIRTRSVTSAVVSSSRPVGPAATMSSVRIVLIAAAAGSSMIWTSDPADL